MIINIIYLFVRDYISSDQFENYFLDNIDQFEHMVNNEIYTSLLILNWKSENDIIHIKQILYKYLEENYPNIITKLTDAYLERLYDSNEDSEIINLIKENTDKDKLIVLDFKRIDNTKELIQYIKKHLKFPVNCGDNWEAIDDFIFEINLPDQIIIYGMQDLSMALSKDSRILVNILNRLSKERSVQIEIITN